jgi:hypothetical protein
VNVRIGALTVVAMLTACNPQPPPGTAGPTPSPTAAAGATLPPVNVTSLGGTPRHPLVFTLQRNNRLRYRLTAIRGTARITSGITEATLQDTTAAFYDKNGKALTARSPIALLDQSNPHKTITMLGGVHAVSGGHTLTCRELVYRQADDTLHGDGDVVVTGPNGMRLTGNHFDSDVTLTNIRIR